MTRRTRSALVGYSVTFEFETRAPLTHRGEVELGYDGDPVPAVRTAVRAAKTAVRPVGWTSLVCVLDKHAFAAPAGPGTGEPDPDEAV